MTLRVREGTVREPEKALAPVKLLRAAGRSSLGAGAVGSNSELSPSERAWWAAVAAAEAAAVPSGVI